MLDDLWAPVRTGQAGSKWFNAPVMVTEGNLEAIRNSVPEYERRSLGAFQPHPIPFSRINERLDLVLRKPILSDPHTVPIGVVSKDYQLVTHGQVIDATLKALKDNKISDAWGKVTLTQYGERMNLSVFLPEKYEFDPGDGHALAMQLECFNSVEGSTKFRVFIGWFRFICMNGLIIGVVRTNFQHRHTPSLSINDIGSVLSKGFANATKDKENLVKWVHTPVTPEKLACWTEGPLHKAWGFKAATRAYHIATSCYDVDIVGPYKDHSPVTIPVKQTRRVPGAEHAENAYLVSQALAWLARSRRDFQEQLEWREQIPRLMRKLVN